MVRRLPFLYIKDIVQIMNECQDQQFDVIFFIEGKRGLGKSTLGWLLSRRARSIFKPKEDLCYSRAEVIRQLQHKKRRVIFADEMINVGFKRDFYEGDQKILIKGLNMYRDSFNIFIGCIPNFQNLDSQLRDLCKLRFTVLRRGIAIVHKQVQSQFMTDKWDTKNNTKIEMKWSASRTKKPRYGAFSTAIAYLKFPNLNPKERALYETLKEQKRNRVFGEVNELGQNLMERSFYDKLVTRIMKGDLTKKEVRLIVNVEGKKWSDTLRILNSKLKDIGSDKTVSKFFKEEPKKKKKEIEKWAI